MSQLIIAVLISFTLVGCAIAPNKVSITFDSYPPGATISSDTKVFGIAPTTVVWTLNAAGARTTSEPIIATWVSGAKVSTQMNLVGGKKEGFIFQRPSGVAGLDADIQWAIHLSQQKQIQNAETSKAWANLGKALGGGGSSPAPGNNSGLKTYYINGKMIMCNEVGNLTSCY